MGQPQTLRNRVEERFGTYYVRGSVVRIALLVAWNRQGTPIETLFRRFPHMERASILYAMAFAAEHPEMFP